VSAGEDWGDGSKVGRGRGGWVGEVGVRGWVGGVVGRWGAFMGGGKRKGGRGAGGGGGRGEGGGGGGLGRGGGGWGVGKIWGRDL